MYLIQDSILHPQTESHLVMIAKPNAQPTRVTGVVSRNQQCTLYALCISVPPFNSFQFLYKDLIEIRIIVPYEVRQGNLGNFLDWTFLASQRIARQLPRRSANVLNMIFHACSFQ